MKSKYLILGAESLIGGALRRHWGREGHEVVGTYLDPTAGAAQAQSVHLDLNQDPETWPRFPDSDAAVICSGITNLEVCRREPVAARLVNVTRTLELARRLRGRANLVVFLSSNLVFDGTQPRRPADDPVCPQTEYGRQKAAVEAGLRQQGGSWAVVRLTKVMHPQFSLLRQWLTALRAGQEIRPFSDFVCAPIPLEVVVRGLAKVAEIHGTGYWQFSPAADLTYVEMARLWAGRLQLSPGLIRPIDSREILQAEHVPAHTTLAADRAVRELGLEIPSAEATMRRMAEAGERVG